MKIDLKAAFAGLDTDGLSIYQWENEVRVQYPSRSWTLEKKAELVAGLAMNRLGVQTGLGGVDSGISTYVRFRLP